MRSVRGRVDTAYSQFELHPGTGARVHGPVDLGLATDEFGEHVVLTVPREHGPAAVEVQRHGSTPDLDPAWDTVAEWSLRTGERCVVTGWAGSGVLEVPVAPDLEVRVRYVVLGGQAEQDRWHVPDGSAADADRYLLQIWPASPAAPRVLRADVPWSQYWAFGAEAEALVEAHDATPDPERMTRVLDAALRAHPEVVAHLRAGDDRYRSGIVRFAQRVLHVTHASGAYPELRADHEALAALIDARVAVAPGPAGGG